jgi:hypothetical protein
VPGALLVYDLAFTNAGDQDAALVAATETVPAATSFAAAASSPGWICGGIAAGAAGAACSLSLGPLAAGATVHRSFAVEVANPLPAGVAAIANTGCCALVLETRGSRAGKTAAVPAARAAPAAAGGACATISTPTLGKAIPTLVKSYAGGPAQAGATLVFALALGNSGNQDAAAATLDETVPQHTRFAPAASSPGWSCAPASGAAGAACTLAVGPLPAGAAGGIAARTFAVTVDAPLPAGVEQIANAACLRDGAGGSACSRTATPPAPPGPPPPVPPAAVSATLADAIAGVPRAGGGPDDVVAHPGDVLEYTLVVSDPAAGAASEVEIATTLDPHLTLDNGSVTTTAGTITLGNRPGDPYPVVHLASLAPGDSVTIVFRASIPTTLPAGLGFLSSQAAISGANFSPAVSDDPETPEPFDPTTTPLAVVAPQAVPAAGTFGLCLLAVTLAATSLLILRRRPGAATSPCALRRQHPVSHSGPACGAADTAPSSPGADRVDRSDRGCPPAGGESSPR